MKKFYLLFCVILLSLICVGCTFNDLDKTDLKTIPEHEDGQYINYIVSFENYDDFNNFYKEFKKQNKITILTFDFDENMMFGFMKYEFVSSAFDSTQLAEDNLYNYCFNNYSFSYTFNSLSNYPEQNGDSTAFHIECIMINYVNLAITKEDLTFVLVSSDSENHTNTYTINYLNTELLKIKINISTEADNDYFEEILSILKDKLIVLKYEEEK